MNTDDLVITATLIGLLAYAAGYVMGTLKAETKAEQMRRWWYERERRGR